MWWLPFRNKFPHEIFPELLLWKENDLVKLGNWSSNKSYYYLGCDGKSVFLKSTNNPYKVICLSPRETRWQLYKNPSLETRKSSEDYYVAQKNLSTNQYNEFLKIQLDFRNKLLMEMENGD